jgi:hypothetical protein
MTPRQAADITAPRSENQIRLEAWVNRALEAAPKAADPAAQLRNNIAHIQAQIMIASAYTDEPLPAYIRGITAFDLTEALERLEAALWKIEREPNVTD